MKVKFKPSPASFDGFDGLKRTCVRYATKRISGAGQAKSQLRCVKFAKASKHGIHPPCKGGGRNVKGRSPGLLRAKRCAR